MYFRAEGRISYGHLGRTSLFLMREQNTDNKIITIM